MMIELNYVTSNMYVFCSYKLQLHIILKGLLSCKFVSQFQPSSAGQDLLSDIDNSILISRISDDDDNDLVAPSSQGSQRSLCQTLQSSILMLETLCLRRKQDRGTLTKGCPSLPILQFFLTLFKRGAGRVKPILKNTDLIKAF